MDKNKINHSTYPFYDNNDLGLSFSENIWRLKVWSPNSDSVKINIYSTFDATEPLYSTKILKNKYGVWEFSANDVNNRFYELQFMFNGKWSQPTIDPYVKLTGPNGKRGYFDLPSAANPAGWDEDTLRRRSDLSDVIIYELNIRDFTKDSTAGAKNPGDYSGFVEAGLSYNGVSVGMDHLVDLGVTHVHLLPFFDFASIDELKRPYTYNWGYDPLNYNVPEGSFSADVFDPLVRVSELKTLIKTLHDNGIGVIMDVVYNHTSHKDDHPFEITNPGYYYRKTDAGQFSNASACGNEVATEKPMVQKFIMESMMYWVEEYHIDGFRVDLMGIHDIEGMNLIAERLRQQKPELIIYGEGWSAGPSPLPDSLRALKANTGQLNDIAVFSDELRDGLKGHFSNKKDKGFVSGNEGYRESVKFGIVAGIQHDQIDYSKINYTDKPWSPSPAQFISYVSCHDDMTLWDKLKVANPEASLEDLIKMDQLANTVVLTSQGIPFIHGGADFLRTKNGDHNSFESPDSVNSIKWDQKLKYYDVYEYYKGLINLRKQHPAFRMKNQKQVRESLRFADNSSDNAFISYTLGPYANGDDWKWIRVYFNGNQEEKVVQLPKGGWKSVIEDNAIYMQGIVRDSLDLKIPPHSAKIIFQE